ncbi:hypothetical protein SAMN04488504_11418 [Myxococcus virescens]|uniref:Uncharacterized protein n=1 Tax=Myxococcus virescens TaxID=83456 RepID=A0ABY0N2M7_9BACT|nr:hypothetical protein SAMN04488504_11418 [Myxococcus virescens]
MQAPKKHCSYPGPPHCPCIGSPRFIPSLSGYTRWTTWELSRSPVATGNSGPVPRGRQRTRHFMHGTSNGPPECRAPNEGGGRACPLYAELVRRRSRHASASRWTDAARRLPRRSLGLRVEHSIDGAERGKERIAHRPELTICLLRRRRQQPERRPTLQLMFQPKGRVVLGKKAREDSAPEARTAGVSHAEQRAAGDGCAVVLGHMSPPAHGQPRSQRRARHHPARLRLGCSIDAQP